MARMMQNRRETTEDNESEGSYVSLLNRSRKDIKPAGLIPCGVWKIRCVGAKLSSFHDEKEDKDVPLVTLTHEPFENVSADPAEVNSVDPDTGLSPYAGKRIFTKFYVRDNNTADRLARIMDLHFDQAEDGEGTTLAADLEAMKGKVVQGEVKVSSWKDRSTGENRQDSAVGTWARAE